METTKNTKRALEHCKSSLLVLLMMATTWVSAYSPSVVNLVNGNRSAILVPSTGLPLVVFHSGSQIRALKCANTLCTGVPSSNTALLNLSSVTRITVVTAADGLPLIGLSFTFAGPRAIKCNDAACTTFTASIIDNFNSGSFADHDLIVPPDGLPIFAYLDGSAGDLKVARCANSACTSVGSVVIADALNFAGRAPSIALIGGLPNIAYGTQVAGTSAFKLLRCGSIDCSTGNSISTLSTENTSPHSMMVGRDGNLMIAYMSDLTTQDQLRLLKCLNAACLTFTTSTIDSVNSGLGLGDAIKMFQGSDGLPVMAYLDRTFSTIKFARCTRPDCATLSITTLDANAISTPSSGTNLGLSMNADGLPVVTYATSPNFVRLQSCNTRSCQ